MVKIPKWKRIKIRKSDFFCQINVDKKRKIKYKYHENYIINLLKIMTINIKKFVKYMKASLFCCLITLMAVFLFGDDEMALKVIAGSLAFVVGCAAVCTLLFCSPPKGNMSWIVAYYASIICVAFACYAGLIDKYSVS